MSESKKKKTSGSSFSSSSAASSSPLVDQIVDVFPGIVECLRSDDAGRIEITCRSLRDRIELAVRSLRTRKGLVQWITPTQHNDDGDGSSQECCPVATMANLGFLSYGVLFDAQRAAARGKAVLAVGDSHSLVVSSEGQVLSFGVNAFGFGVLGAGESEVGRVKAVPFPVLMVGPAAPRRASKSSPCLRVSPIPSR